MLHYVITALVTAVVTAVIVVLFNSRRRGSSSSDNGDRTALLENSLEEERAARIKSDEEVVRLKKEVHWLTSILDALPTPLSVTDKDMNWTFINKIVEDMLGLDRAKVIGQHCSNWGAHICNTDKCGVALLRKGIGQSYFSQLGREFTVTGHYIYDENGELAGHVEAVRDITELTDKTKEFEEKAYWYESILDAIPMPLSITDTDMNWTFINRATENYLGKKRSEVVGRHCSEWGATICNTEKCGVNCLRNGKPETVFEHGGMTFKVNVAYLTDAKQKTVGHIEVVQDITELLKTQRELPRLVDNVRRISSSFKQASTEISGGAQTLAESTQEQSATVQQLLASAADVAEKTKANADMAGKTAALAATIKNSAEKGSRQMDEMVAAVGEISGASQSISKIIKVINDIAFQTNLLALNAAVEAARAGNHGRGFGVVAEEVRTLAAKSAKAAKDTDELISNSMEKARRGAGIAKETAESLVEIVSGINESGELISEIATASEAQSVSITQINNGIDQVARVVQQTSATAQESAASSLELNGQAESLEQMISQFFHVLRRASDRDPNAVSIPPNGIERRKNR